MTPEEITQAYQVLADQVRDNMATNAATIGNSQRSLGPLASRVASPSGQTSGLANYTYNRLLRPTLDTSTAALTVNGKSQALSKFLGDQLRAAKERYEDAQNNYAVASTTPSTTGGYTPSEDKTSDYTSGTVFRYTMPYDELLDGVQYYWNPQTGNVVVNGVELQMSPRDYHRNLSKGFINADGSTTGKVQNNWFDDMVNAAMHTSPVGWGLSQLLNYANTQTGKSGGGGW